MNQYFYEVRKLAESFYVVVGKRASVSLTVAMKKRPRILVCAPSNSAIDNVISKIMEWKMALSTGVVNFLNS